MGLSTLNVGRDAEERPSDNENTSALRVVYSPKLERHCPNQSPRTRGRLSAFNECVYLPKKARDAEDRSPNDANMTSDDLYHLKSNYRYADMTEHERQCQNGRSEYTAGMLQNECKRSRSGPIVSGHQSGGFQSDEPSTPVDVFQSDSFHHTENQRAQQYQKRDSGVC